MGIYLQGNAATGGPASTGTWTPDQPYPSVQWTWDCNPAASVPGTPIASAINRTYQIADSDVGHTLCIVVDTGGVEAITAPTGVVAPGPPIDQTAPTISGVTAQGQGLTASPGTWRGTSGITFSYQWKRCNSAGGVCGKPFTAPSSSPTYVLQAADVGHTMQVLVTATNSAGSTTAGAKQATAVVTPPNSASPGNPAGPGGSNNNKGGQNGNPQGGQGPTTGSSTNIHALLMKALAVQGPGGRIRALVKNGGYSLSFAAPSPGRVVISWYRAAKHGRGVLLATAIYKVRKTGTVRIKLVLTRKGRELLARARKMKLTANGAFTPAGKGTIRATRAITLKP